MPDVWFLILLAVCCVAGALYGVTCLRSALTVGKAKRGERLLYVLTACSQIAVTALAVCGNRPQFLVFLLLFVHIVLYALFLRMSADLLYYTAALHALLFTAARLVITALGEIVFNRRIYLFREEIRFDAVESYALPLLVLLWSYLLACVFERIARTACVVGGTQTKTFSKKTLLVLNTLITAYLAVSVTEGSLSDAESPDARLFALVHLVLYVILFAALWLFVKYRSTVNHAQHTRTHDTRAREMRYYSYYSTQAQTLEEMRRFRHDYKNQLAGLKVLIDSGEYERASAYLAGIATRFDSARTKTRSYSDNMLVDTILQNLAHRCEEAGIEFSAEVPIGSEIPLADYELCTVLCNMADNAFEAASKCTENRFISFTGSRRVKWLTVTAENSYDGVLLTDKGGIVTRKSDRASHGLGLKSIRAIVESVPGANVRIEPDPEEKVFCISLIFPRPGADESL